MKKILKTFIIFLSIATVISQCGVIFLSNARALESVEAKKLTGAIDKLDENNMDLETQIFSLSSYNLVASKAADLGYTKTSDIVSVYDPIPLALKR